MIRQENYISLNLALKNKTVKKMGQEFALALSAILTAGITYLLTRRKNNTDIKKTTADTLLTSISTVDKVIAIWQDLATKLSAQVVELRLEIGELKVEVKKLTEENRLYAKQLLEFRESNEVKKIQNG